MTFSSRGIARTISPSGVRRIAMSSWRSDPNPAGTVTFPVVSSAPGAGSIAAGVPLVEDGGAQPCVTIQPIQPIPTNELRRIGPGRHKRGDRARKLVAPLARHRAEWNGLLGVELERLRNRLRALRRRSSRKLVALCQHNDCRHL